ncbi:ABC transporter ATP-binding protein [Prosthecobacter sp.]|uniref:ABC transporter ATP-binding protein n=1 Tax=Prosthecobacter sp. TaxID=1965333 RepID=UPI003782FFA0
MPVPSPVSSSQIAVSCRGLTKTFGSGATAFQALRGVDLEVRTGEMLMLVGPSGCGKTTLISIIAGVLRRDGGECSVFGHDYLSMPEQEITRFRGTHTGFVFQAFNLIPTLTAAENVSAPLVINGMKRKAAMQEASEMLRRVGFDERMLESSPVDLSGGQQQRVAIARSLVHQPDLIVCDEPTSALDGETGRKVMQLMRELALATNRALIVVTHDARIFDFADRIAHMEDGRITSIETPERAAASA